jgi:L-fucose isomerase-like protein
MDSAREELTQVLQKLGHDVIMLPKEATRFGAVETPQEGKIFADFLREHRGEYGGIILSLPNFGDENGAMEAFKEADVPIFIQAYPDEFEKMSPEYRRDAFCGKFSIMDVFNQCNIPFTAQKPHTVSPSSEAFAKNIDYFDRVCRVVNGMKHMKVGALGARTTAFKTVRLDEITLQRHNITVETIDLSDLFVRMGDVSEKSDEYRNKQKRLTGLADWSGVPDDATDKLVRLGVAIDQVIEEMDLDAVALRCWVEMQSQLGISPCILVGELNDRGIPTACEVDIGNAVTMFALEQASDSVATCLDWNNNYGENDEKCILFHCGPVPPSLMREKGKVTEHAILKNAVGDGCSYGCNQGRIQSTPFTFGSMVTEAGRCKFFLGTGRFTDDPIPESFFGCAGVAHIEGLQDVLLHIGYEGHRHHVSVAPGEIVYPVCEALTRYLGCEVTMPQLDRH